MSSVHVSYCAVYFFPRIVRYFEEGVPLVQSFRKAGFIPAIAVSLQNTISKKRPSHESTEVASGFSNDKSGVGKASSSFVPEGGMEEKGNSKVSSADGNAEDGHAFKVEVNGGTKEVIDEDIIEEIGQGVEENDAIDELEHIVQA